MDFYLNVPKPVFGAAFGIAAVVGLGLGVVVAV